MLGKLRETGGAPARGFIALVSGYGAARMERQARGRAHMHTCIPRRGHGCLVSALCSGGARATGAGHGTSMHGDQCTVGAPMVSAEQAKWPGLRVTRTARRNTREHAFAPSRAFCFSASQTQVPERRCRAPRVRAHCAEFTNDPFVFGVDNYQIGRRRDVAVPSCHLLDIDALRASTGVMACR
jgi:hypothetical protein